MLKTTVAVLTVALAGTAGATGWRALRIDGVTRATRRLGRLAAACFRARIEADA